MAFVVQLTLVFPFQQDTRLRPCSAHQMLSSYSPVDTKRKRSSCFLLHYTSRKSEGATGRILLLRRFRMYHNRIEIRISLAQGALNLLGPDMSLAERSMGIKDRVKHQI